MTQCDCRHVKVTKYKPKRKTDELLNEICLRHKFYFGPTSLFTYQIQVCMIFNTEGFLQQQVICDRKQLAQGRLSLALS